MEIPLDQQCTVFCVRGGGTEAVAFFFGLSGFVVALHSRRESLRFSSSLQLCRKKVKRFYGLHIFFSIIVIPTMIYTVVREPVYSIVKFIINVLLLQSWFPDEQMWLSYNSVAWFLSTLTFLCLFIVPLHYICNRIEQRTSSIKIYAAILAVDWLIAFLLAFLLGNFCNNIQYWLYAFPPARLMDYISGFVLGRIFVLQKNHRLSATAATYLEVVAASMIILYLLLFPYVPAPFARAAIYQPGAAFAIYIFAIGKGQISKILSSPVMVKLGGNSLYYMMSHQVILRYCALIHKQLVKRGMISCEIIWIIIAFALTLISKPVYEGLCSKFRKMKKV